MLLLYTTDGAGLADIVTFHTAQFFQPSNLVNGNRVYYDSIYR